MVKKGLMKHIMNDNISLISAISLIIISFLIGSIFMSGYSLGGYSSVVAEWDRIEWEDPYLTDPYGKSITEIYGTTWTWDGNDVTAPYNLNPAAGDIYMTDWTRYSGNIDQPKFDHNIDYHGWWINDTVTENNPVGEAEHFEWTVDEYRMMITFNTHGSFGLEKAGNAIWWLNIKNNFESVFSQLGAEKASSYVIGAYVGNYTWAPLSANWHLINPVQGTYDLYYVEGDTVPPPGFEEGSEIDFTSLEKYSNIEIQFSFADYGSQWLGSDCTVNIEVYLNVLTVGRFDHVLTYESGGENSDAPVGAAGAYDSIAGALEAGLSGLADISGELLSEAYGPIIFIAVIVCGIMVLVIVIRFGGLINRFAGKGKQ